MKAFSWIFIVSGVWSIAAAFIFKFGGASFWNGIILGILIFVCGFLSLGEDDSLKSDKQ